MLETKVQSQDLSKEILRFCTSDFINFHKWVIDKTTFSEQLKKLLRTLECLENGEFSPVPADELVQFILNVGNLFITTASKVLAQISSDESLQAIINIIKPALGHLKYLLSLPSLRSTFAKSSEKEPLLIEQLLQDLVKAISAPSSSSKPSSSHADSKSGKSACGFSLSTTDLAGLFHFLLSNGQLTEERTDKMIDAIGALAASGNLSNSQINLVLPDRLAVSSAWLLGMGRLAAKKLLKSQQPVTCLNCSFKTMLQQHPTPEAILSALQGAGLLIKSSLLKNAENFNVDLLGHILCQLGPSTGRKNDIKSKLALEILTQIEEFYQCLPIPRKKFPIKPVCDLLQKFLLDKSISSNVLVTLLSKFSRLLQDNKYGIHEIAPLKLLLQDALEKIANDPEKTIADSVEGFYSAVLIGAWEPPKKSSSTFSVLNNTKLFLEQEFRKSFIACLHGEAQYSTISAKQEKKSSSGSFDDLDDYYYKAWISGKKKHLSIAEKKLLKQVNARLIKKLNDNGLHKTLSSQIHRLAQYLSVTRQIPLPEWMQKAIKLRAKPPHDLHNKVVEGLKTQLPGYIVQKECLHHAWLVDIKIITPTGIILIAELDGWTHRMKASGELVSNSKDLRRDYFIEKLDGIPVERIPLYKKEQQDANAIIIRIIKALKKIEIEPLQRESSLDIRTQTTPILPKSTAKTPETQPQTHPPLPSFVSTIEAKPTTTTESAQARTETKQRSTKTATVKHYKFADLMGAVNEDDIETATRILAATTLTNLQPGTTTASSTVLPCPLMTALRSYNAQTEIRELWKSVIKIMVDQSPIANLTPIDRVSPLVFAAQNNMPDIVELILQKAKSTLKSQKRRQKNKNQDSPGWSLFKAAAPEALYHAQQAGHEAVVKLLQKHGIKPITDAKQKSQTLPEAKSKESKATPSACPIPIAPSTAIDHIPECLRGDPALVTLFHEACMGNAESQYRLGYKYYEGIELRSGQIHIDYAKSLGWLAKADSNNSDKAQMTIGHFYADGFIIERNPEMAVSWYQKAIETSKGTNMEALFNLAKCYESGIGVEQDTDKAIELFKKAEKNFPEAQLELGLRYLYGDGVDKDIKQGVAYIRRAAQKNSDAQMEFGRLYASGIGVEKNMEHAVEWYRKATETGEHAEAAYELAKCFLKGIGVEQNCAEAIEYFEVAVAQKYPAAEVELGCIYIDGTVTQQNIERGLELIRPHAAKGDPYAQVKLGECYLTGNGVEQNQATALDLLKKSAAAKNKFGLFRLGTCYANMPGNLEARPAAVQCYTLAAEQGLSDAQRELGLCYLGGFGVIASKVDAIRWLKSAARQGDKVAKTHLKELTREKYAALSHSSSPLHSDKPKKKIPLAESRLNTVPKTVPRVIPP